MARSVDSTSVPTTSRRVVLGALAAVPLGGVIFDAPAYAAKEIDYAAVAEGWLTDAYALGMIVVMGPDGQLWKTMPIGDGDERAEARDNLLVKLDSRPRLRRAIYAAVKGGFIA